MQGFAKSFKVALVLCAVVLPINSFAAKNLEIVTFNTRWFGSPVDDPRSANPKPIDPVKFEARTKIMADFISKHIKNKDVISFQEVVDLPLLQSLLPKSWHCETYETNNRYHQRVVLCASGKYQWQHVPYDNNFSIEEVATDLEWSRPALRLDLADLNGNRLVRFVAVHLKAMQNYSRERQRQVNVIAQDLKKDNSVPTVILGDMNTYSAKQTGQDRDDLEKLVAVLQKQDNSFKSIQHQVKYTYRSPRYGSLFDHVFINKGITAKAAPNVYEVCNSSENGQGYMNFSYYYKNVSDHCPVSVSLTIQ